MSNIIQNTYELFTDIDGTPLEDGYIFIGVAGLDPIANPLQAYWDEALTVPASAIRTKGGYPVHSTFPGRLYIATNYSVLVQNKRGLAVYASVDSKELYVNRVKAKVLWTGPLSVGATPTSLDGGEKFSDWDEIIIDMNTTSDTAIFGAQTTQTILIDNITNIPYFLSATGSISFARLSDTTFQVTGKTATAANLSRITGISL